MKKSRETIWLKMLRWGEAVLLGHYVKPKLWRKSNRIYRRILAALPPDLAAACGYVESRMDRLKRELEAARECGDWSLVAAIAAELKRIFPPA
jgi:hypothetical protein